MSTSRSIGGVSVKVALVGMMAAMLECGKLVLSGIPNVEVVTLLLALFSVVFGWYGVLAAGAFVAIEPLLYGFGYWVIAYALYWPFVAVIFCLIGHFKIKNRWICAVVAVLLTAWFGVLTSLVEVGLFSGSYQDFWHRFGIYYARGVWFYVTQIVCNLVLFCTLYPLLRNKLIPLRNRLFPAAKHEKNA